MGYYACIGGEIKLKCDTPEHIKNELKKALEEDFCTVEIENDEYSFSDDIKYQEDVWYELLEKIEPYTISGNISCKGEDYSLWQFDFRNAQWYEDDGKVVYESGKPVKEYGQLYKEFVKSVDCSLFDSPKETQDVGSENCKNEQTCESKNKIQGEMI